MRWTVRISTLFLALTVMLTAAQGQPGGEDVEVDVDVEEEATCGLTRAEIPLGLTEQQANALVLGMAPPRTRLALELLEGVVWRYQLTDPYASVAEWLKAPRSLPHRLQLFSTLALLGAGELREPEAREFFSTMVQVRDSYDWKGLFRVLARLDSDRFDQPALEQLQRVITSLGTSDEDYSIRIERLNLTALLSEQEFRLLAARKIIRETLAFPRAQRLASTADRYAEIDGGFSEILTPWAAARLVRETWAAEPSQQTSHSPQPDRVAEVAQALRNCMKRAGSPEIVEDADQRLGIKLRLLRALRHIKAPLSAQEEGFIADNNGHHVDRLD